MAPPRSPSPSRHELHTTCNRDCPDVCRIVATVEDGRVTQLRGDREHPVTQGFLCYRTNQFLKTQYSPDRLTQPLVRRGDHFEPISWDAALDLAAAELVRIRDTYGPAAIFHYRSAGSMGITKAVTDLFFEAFGPVTIKRGDICSGAGEWAQTMDFGEADASALFDLENARHIILWGKNVYTSSPHSLPVLKRAKENGARLTLIDPVHHRTAAICDAYVQPRPGGDLALALAVARIIFERGWVHPDADQFCDGLEGLEALARRRSLAAWCREAEVDEAEALALADALREGPTTILVGWGMGRRRNGATIVRAVDALGAITGNVGIAGAGVSFYFKRGAPFDTSFVAGIAAAPRTIPEPLFGPGILAAQDPPIQAVWVTAGNPVAMMPESQTSARALESRELVVVVDSFMTDTARRAHLVLPTTTLLEADDILGAYGNHYVSVARPVVPPPPGVKTDLEIMQALASRVGLSDVVAGDARSWQDRVLTPAAKAGGLTLEALEKGAVRSPVAPRIAFEGRRFKTPSGKANLLTELPEPAQRELDEPREEAYPLYLLSVSTPKSQASQWAAPLGELAEVTVHPDSAAGAPDGGRARLESAMGALEVRVRHDAAQRRDVALLPKGGHYDAGHSANALIAAELTDGGEGGALYDQRVRLVVGGELARQ